MKVEGFKSFESIDLPFRDGSDGESALNVVIGPNGAGKSNLIGVFRFVHELVNQRLGEIVGRAGGANRFLFHGPKRTRQIQLTFDFGVNAYKVALEPANDGLVLRSETAFLTGSNWNLAVHFSSTQPESQLSVEAADPKATIAQDVLARINSWANYHFHDTSETAWVKGLCDLDDNRQLRSDASNLAAYLYYLKQAHTGDYLQITNQVRLVAPFFHSFVLEPARRNPNTIKIEWQHVKSDAYFDAFSLSDGTLRFICLATLLLQPELPSTIVIDEPELGLHPFAIRLLADLLRSAARRTQVIIATQSVTLLNQLEPEDIVVTEHDGERSTVKRLSRPALEEWLKDYALGELWEKNVLGGRPR